MWGNPSGFESRAAHHPSSKTPYEPGGANPQDQEVPLGVSGADVERYEVRNAAVETTQIGAPPDSGG